MGGNKCVSKTGTAVWIQQSVSVERVLNDHMGKISQKWLSANCGEAA